MVVITVSEVVRTFGDLRALDGIDLEVKKGEFFGLLGPNGAGKSTLLKLLTGQLTQDSGKVEVLGIGNNEPLSIRSRVGIVPESETPPSFLTAREFLELVCRIRGLKGIDGTVDHWLDFFKITGKSKVLCKDLSKGQRQKVMLASAFISQPKLLFLDEPFINLDPIFQRKVRDHLKKISEEGVTIFMCTHILEIAEKLCTRVALINSGKIVGQGSVNELREEMGDDLESIFMRLVEDTIDE
jgi:ABC-2 type transport system ATP-binding protein